MTLRREDIVVGGDYYNNQGVVMRILAIHGDKLWTQWENGTPITISMSLALNNWTKAPKTVTKYVFLWKGKHDWYPSTHPTRHQANIARCGLDRVTEIQEITFEVPDD